MITPAYIAGFFDGEGSITIHENCRPSPRGKSPNHTLQISIGNTDPTILVLIHKQFGGSFSERKVTKPNHRRFFQWTVRAAAAKPFLEAIEPFVVMKKKQVQTALEFQNAKRLCRGQGNKYVTPEELSSRECHRSTIRNLNACQVTL